MPSVFLMEQGVLWAVKMQKNQDTPVLSRRQAGFLKPLVLFELNKEICDYSGQA
jgi:hypothetical protein